MPGKWTKNNTEDIIWWLDNRTDTKGEWVFSFDKKRRFNMFADYPWKLTPEQKEIFDRGNPYWRGFSPVGNSRGKPIIRNPLRRVFSCLGHSVKLRPTY